MTKQIGDIRLYHSDTSLRITFDFMKTRIICIDPASDYCDGGHFIHRWVYSNTPPIVDFEYHDASYKCKIVGVDEI